MAGGLSEVRTALAGRTVVVHSSGGGADPSSDLPLVLGCDAGVAVPAAGLRAVPRKGMLLAWNNMNPDGSPNTATLHEGMPVVEGVKYIVTKWFREHDWVPMPA